ncbi:biotin synthase-related enzyme [Desulfosporosinus orientis DSM 765]|uniref:Biotin synthase-related enzyme n=1 Tax=Desulfosporosinus orientis (strain ATCC 19365 / DSM 765 / NCIMB 8382 / VKM B-1628 / Singapore I) TaxID=768706 RepID=G7WCF8_DESOD|nr:radical SAM protein [Desulfosporosinus orientis]AET66280.1 biotin synthase-related enzyme [Desulfosporosinus orientis DSM 765]
MIRCSAGTAKVLGLNNIKTDTLPTTAYLMVGDHCKFNCAFCSQARESRSKTNLLSRVVWPEFDDHEVMRSLHLPEAQKVMQRVCFQVVQDGKALQEVSSFVSTLKNKSPEMPVCVSAGPRSLNEIGDLLKHGVDRVSLALDAATPEVFARTKDGSWQSRYELLLQAAEMFPGHIGTHLIVGLGETEEEMVRIIQQMYDKGITVALFAFTPIKGTRMEHLPKPELEHYRRIQAAHYLIRRKYAREDDFILRSGRIVSFSINLEQLWTYLSTGEAFQTSGCPGCNRPYYNESPREELYNYPRPLTSEEVKSSWTELISGIE